MSQSDKQHIRSKKHAPAQECEFWNTDQRRLRRDLGQNFLKHQKTARKIVRAAGVTEHDLVVEIGAGSGMLTRPLSKTARKVMAVEYDPYWASRLKQGFAGCEDVEVITADALFVPLPDEPFSVVASLPFHLSTAILQRLLDDPAKHLERLHLLLQREVAAKHARSTPTTLKTLTWSPWWRFEAGYELPASAFEPEPEVDARLLVVAKRNPPLLAYERRKPFQAFVREAFDGRGNVVGQTLRRVFTRRQILRLARDNGFSTGSFPSQLTVHQWAAVFKFMVRAVPQHRWPGARAGAITLTGREGRG